MDDRESGSVGEPRVLGAHPTPSAPSPSPLWDERHRLRLDVEALLFASGRPLVVEKLAEAASHAHRVPAESIVECLEALQLEYPVGGPRGFELARVAGGWLFRTNAVAEPALSRLFDVHEDPRLSPAALETLAIVAYLQPVSRPEITEIRGVNSDSALHTLLDREMVQEMGRREGPGAAVLYGTTERFLVAFDLPGLDQLPSLSEFDVDEEQKEELRRRLGVVVQAE